MSDDFRRPVANGHQPIRKLVSYALMGIGVLWLAVTGVCGSILLGEPSETRLSSQDIFYAWLLVGAAVLVGGVFLLVGWLLRTR
jgi:hypothetical protein